MNALSVRFGFLFQLFSGWVDRRQLSVIESLLEENRLRREPLEGRRGRLTDDQRRRLAVQGQGLGRRVLGEVAGLVTPDTLRRWSRRLVARKYDGSRRRGPGRPRTKRDRAGLVLRMAKENPRWGDTRIRGAMKSLGHEIGRSPVERILRDRGIEAAPPRGERTSWGPVLATHWEALAAADCFTVEVLTLGGLVRSFVFFVIRLKTRTVEIAGLTSQPTEAWMTPIARNLTDSHNGFLRGMDHRVLDRDPLSSRPRSAACGATAG